MAVTVRRPGPVRLAVTLGGLAVAAAGVVTWGTGDIAYGVAEQEVAEADSATWGDVLGYRSDEAADLARARQDLSDAGGRRTAGVVVAVLGVALAGSRWLVHPATANTPVNADPRTDGATNSAITGTGSGLTPEQEREAVAMYLAAKAREWDGE